MVRPAIVRLAAVLLALTLPLAAATPPGSAPAPESNLPVPEESSAYEAPARKEPSFWHRPAEKTPAAQLALARRYVQEKRFSRAIEASDDLVHRWHETPEAVAAQQALARLLEQEGQYTRAFAEYQYLIANYAGRFPFFGAIEGQYRVANACRTRRRTFLGLTVSALEEVRLMYEQILRNGPRWEQAPQVALLVGTLRENDDELTEAVVVYDQVRNRYPDSEAARDAVFLAAACRARLADEHPRNAQLLLDATAALNACARDYPADPRRAQIEKQREKLDQRQADASFERALFYDRQRQDRAAAIIAYRDFLRRHPGAPQAVAAAARLERLERAASGQTNQVSKGKQP